MPLVRFQDFGDSSLTFVLVAWINNVIKLRQINSDLHHQVFHKLKEAGVTIAFPQRDVHIHGIPELAITKSPRPVTKSPKPVTVKSPKPVTVKSPKRAAKKKK
jgi:small-conductance mechanosensitive channel